MLILFIVFYYMFSLLYEYYCAGSIHCSEWYYLDNPIIIIPAISIIALTAAVWISTHSANMRILSRFMFDGVNGHIQKYYRYYVAINLVSYLILTTVTRAAYHEWFSPGGIQSYIVGRSNLFKYLVFTIAHQELSYAFIFVVLAVSILVNLRTFGKMMNICHMHLFVISILVFVNISSVFAVWPAIRGPICILPK